VRLHSLERRLTRELQDEIEQVGLARFSKPRDEKKSAHETHCRDRDFPLEGEPGRHAVGERPARAGAPDAALPGDPRCKDVDHDGFQLGVFAVKKEIPGSHAQGKRGLANDANGGKRPQTGEVSR